MNILADTGPLYALAMQRDALHRRARGELERLDKQNRQLIVSTSTLLETQSLLLRRESPRFAAIFIDALLLGATLVNPTSKDYLAAQALVKRYDDQRFTLFDATLAILATKLKLEIWTFDSDFDVLPSSVWRD